MVGMERLKRKLSGKEPRVRLRYGYYEMKQRSKDWSLTMPEAARLEHSVLGWCAKAVDTLADRISVGGYTDDVLAIGEIFRLNNADVLYDSAVLSALISSCAFIYIGADSDGYPTLQVIDGSNATGVIDPVTNLLTEGYAVLERDENNAVVREAYFLPGETQYFEKGRQVEVFRHNAPYALLVPVIYRPDARRPFGHSRISRACMSLVDSAQRTLRRSEVSAEFYSTPQKYVLGLSENAEFNNRYATISSFLDFRRDENDNVPSIGQFAQQSMSPYSDQIRNIASLFAGETGLTLDDLGFQTSNPASSEAIRAAHENLRLTARKAQRTFAVGFLNTGYLAACVRDNYSYLRRVIADIGMTFKPIFEPDAAALGGLGDAVLKINQAVPEYLGEAEIMQLTGIEKSST